MHLETPIKVLFGTAYMGGTLPPTPLVVIHLGEGRWAASPHVLVRGSLHRALRGGRNGWLQRLLAREPFLVAPIGSP